MEKLTIIFLLLTSNMQVFSQHKSPNNKIDIDFINTKRKLAKDLMRDYFLYNCINDGLLNNGDVTFQKDRTKLLYNAWISYIQKKDLEKIDEYAKKIGGDVFFNSKDVKKQRLFGLCIDKSRSKEFEEMIDKISKREFLGQEKEDF